MKASIFLWLGLLVTASAADISFNREIQPILSKNCFACHGPDEETREAGLRLDVEADAKADLGGYKAIVPGNPDDCELIYRLTAGPDDRMPPPDSGHELTFEEIDLLKAWVQQGAPYEKHWSFVPPIQADPPAVQDEKWSENPIDRFVLRKLEASNLKPNPPANRHTLIRRVSLDLTGLPPTPAETDAFLNDTSPQAYENLVDRLLKSEHFGEQWARMWLDLARYADTKGYEKDKPREIWRYRDWVIDALNTDMPYDQFTIEQLAGDLFPNPTQQQLVATAFHRNTMTNDEGGTDNEEFRVAAVKDRVDTTMQVWMGLTMGCAKCHSHKYDPISMKDYYAFYDFFNQTEDADRPDDAPKIQHPTAAQTKREKELQAQLASLKKEEAPKKEIEKTQNALNNLRNQFGSTPVMRDLPENRQRVTKIHNRGNFLDQGEAVDCAVPPAFGSLPEDAPENRLGVAKWLVSPQNPLTARVAVNRVWARLFGRGLVETEEDFGSQGKLPTHPELLDWLAVEYRDNLAWSLKGLLKTIVLSSIYRQSSAVTGEKLDADPRNDLLTRGPRFRLPAETVRDQALAASGLLSRKVGGPSVMPPQPDGIWKSTYSNLSWETAENENRYRRGLYTYWKRTSPYPAMLTFDAGSREVCQVRRVRTNTPLQALVTLNDPAFVEAAGALAQKMSAAEDPIDHGFRRVLVRPPNDAEHARLQQVFEETKSELDAESADKLIASARVTAENVNPIELAAWITVANVLLNLDETLMKP